MNEWMNINSHQWPDIGRGILFRRTDDTVGVWFWNGGCPHRPDGTPEPWGGEWKYFTDPRDTELLDLRRQVADLQSELAAAKARGER